MVFWPYASADKQQRLLLVAMVGLISYHEYITDLGTIGSNG